MTTASQPLLVIFTGLPGTGKTSISRSVSRELCLPIVAKDAIKEIMYDHIGIGDKAWSGKLAMATFGIMRLMAEEQLEAGNSLIMESNYRPSLENEYFQQLTQRFNFRCVQVVCRTEPAVLAHRVHKRSITDRHPGHNDVASEAEHEQDIHKRHALGDDQPLDIKGSEIILVDTTDFAKIDTAAIAERIRALR